MSSTEYDGMSLSELQAMLLKKKAEVRRSQEQNEIMALNLGFSVEEAEAKSREKPRVDMNSWTPAHEARLRKGLGDAQRYLAEHGQEVSIEELRRLWGVGNAYTEEERNMAVSYEVHEVFAQILDRPKRQELLFSRDDWTPRTAQLAVDAWHRLPDGNRRLVQPEE